MSQGFFALESQRAAATNQLYFNLLETLGSDFKYDRFLGWVSQYVRPSREFHGLDHLLSMSDLSRDLPGRAGIYAMLAGFFHDEDYPSIGEEVTYVSKRFLDKYIEDRDGKKYVKALSEGDEVGKIVYAVFGFKEGQLLSSFPIFSAGTLLNPGGMNEFYCAVAAAGELAELGQDKKFIAAIVTGIEATIAFRSANRMNGLKLRLENADKAAGLGLTAAEFDEIMIAAVHTANKDVSGLLGGLEPMMHDSPTTLSVINTIKGGDMLSPEEVPSLRMRGEPAGKSPGEYSPKDFLAARIKRAGLYHLIIPGNETEQTIPNLFYNVTLSDGSKHPTDEWVERANKLAYANNRPVRVAEYARLISAGIVYSIAALGGEVTNPSNVKLADLVSGMGDRLNPNLSPEASSLAKLAFACLNGRHATTGNDTRRSPLAELVLSKLPSEKIEELGKQSRGLLLDSPTSKPNPQAFLELATQYLDEVPSVIKTNMEILSRNRGKHEVSEAIRAVQMPPYISRV